MTQPIVRIYETEQNARDAMAKLTKEGFSEESVLLVTPQGSEAANAVKAGSALSHRAGFFAERLGAGRSLVIVNAPFGRGKLATGLMDSCKPVDLELRAPEAPAEEWGDATPLSRATGMPVLMRGEPAPFSKAAGLPILSKGLSVFFGGLSNHDMSFSAAFGMPLLSKNPTPLSSALGMDAVSAPKGEKTHSMGFPLLSSDSTPFSQLSNNPTPLSSALGLKVLKHRD